MRIELKRRDINILSQALSALSGRVKAVDVDGKAKLVSEPYDFGGNARYAISRTSKHLRDEVEAIQDALSDLVRKHTIDDQHPNGSDSIADDHPNWNSFQREQREFLRVVATVEVHQCAEADIKADSNKISGELVGMLWPLFSDWNRKAVTAEA